MSAPDFTAFAGEVVKHFIERNGDQLEYDDFLNLGEKYGLVRRETYDPEHNADHEHMDIESEPGDEIFVPTFNYFAPPDAAARP